jgi:hypothetical protein
MSDISKPSANGWRILWLILAGSIAIKLALILYLGPRFHGDVVRAVNFGYGLHEGRRRGWALAFGTICSILPARGA